VGPGVGAVGQGGARVGVGRPVWMGGACGMSVCKMGRGVRESIGLRAEGWRVRRTTKGRRILVIIVRVRARVYGRTQGGLLTGQA